MLDHAIEGRFGATRRRIPNPHYNGDVESFHQLVEFETFCRRRDISDEATTYQHRSSLAPQQLQRWHTPLKPLTEADPRLSRHVLLRPPLDLG